MKQIEAKIDPIKKKMIIDGQSNKGAILDQLKNAFPDLIDEISAPVNKGCLVILMVHQYPEIEKQSNRNDNELGQNLLINQTPLKPIIHFLNDNRYMKSLYSDKKSSKEMRREYEVMDNSIWNFLVPLEDITNEGIPKKDELLKIAIDAIANHYEKGLYELEVTYEFADWNARLFHQSYLIGSHALDVSPHVFHSESAIQQLLRNEFKNNNKVSSYKDGNLKWRFLLVDDYAVKDLRIFHRAENSGEAGKRLNLFARFPNVRARMSPAANATKESISKGDIVHALLASQGFNVECRKWNYDTRISDDVDILIEYAEKLTEAQEALKVKKYDIILLDYLLDGDEVNNIRNYGYELLESIKDNVEKKVGKDYLVGPSGQMFFIFMSAFSSAVQGRLLAQGLNQSEKYWYIDIGACPTNTPQLFTYNLLQLMEKRLDDSGIWRLSSDEVLTVIIKIFQPLKDRTVRIRARDFYHEVLDLYDDFLKMLLDVEVPSDYDTNKGSLFNIKGSVLASHFMLKNHNLGGLLEHFVHLVHLTAFGTVRQWAEMWEEYIYIRAHFKERGFSITNDEIFKDACVHIEKYIFDLKRQQR